MKLTVFIAVLAVLLLSVLFLTTSKSNVPADDDKIVSSSINEQATVGSSTLIIGDPTTPKIVEYMDYKCPNCNIFHRTVEHELNDQYITAKKAHIEIRVTPIFGPDSGRSGRGAYCANDQGVFMQYHTALLDAIWQQHYEAGDYKYELEDYFTTDKIVALTQDFMPDTALLVDCMTSTKYNAQLDSNLNAAADDSIQGTPGFTVGTQSFVGNQPLSVFSALLKIGAR